MSESRAKFSRYHELVRTAARTHLEAADAAPLDSVALALPSARLLLADDPRLHPQLPAGLRALASAGRGRDRPMLADPSGDRRDVYFPLALSLHLRAFGRRYESLSSADWTAVEDVLPACIEAVRSVESAADAAPPADQVALVLWQAWCLAQYGQVLQRDVDLEIADGVVHQIASRPGARGSLHALHPDESLDAWTYRELAGVHALANLAVLRRNRGWARRVQEVARYHLEHTQPDYVTTQPWGLFAFVWSDGAEPLADQQLHDVTSMPATAGGERSKAAALTGLLLADAADALASFA